MVTRCTAGTFHCLSRPELAHHVSASNFEHLGGQGHDSGLGGDEKGRHLDRLHDVELLHADGWAYPR